MEKLSLLKPKLSRLKLSGMLDSLENRISEAIEEKWDYTNFLIVLCTDEIERRDFKQLCRRLNRSNLEAEKTLEVFNFSFNTTIHKPTIYELANCSFIEKKETIFFVGQSGVGKSHLAQAIGHEACRKGYDTLYYNTYNIFKWINSGRGDGSYERRIKQIAKIPLLILDDFGLRDLNENQQADLYQVINDRYEKTSTIITSNRDFNEWPSVFSNPLMGSAAMDRLVHKAIKIVIEGKSYRLNNFINNSKHLTKNANLDK